VLDRLARSNIGNYSIFLGLARDDAVGGPAGPAGPALTLFSHLEYTGADHAADMAAMAADETTKQWWTLTDPMQVPLPERAEGDWWAALPEWHAIEAGVSGHSAEAPARRRAFAFARPSDLTSDPRARFADAVGEFQASIRTLRAFAARQHVYVYLEAAPEFAPDAFVDAMYGALGGSTRPTPLVEVFHTD